MNNVRIKLFLTAHKTFNELVNKSLETDAVIRDACIQRFEYTIDACWKALKIVLLEKYGVETNTPKDAIRASFKANIISNDPFWIQMIDDRNLTSHIYNENMAERIVSNFYHYDKLFVELIDKINSYEK